MFLTNRIVTVLLGITGGDIHTCYSDIFFFHFFFFFFFFFFCRYMYMKQVCHLLGLNLALVLHRLFRILVSEMYYGSFAL